MQNLASIQPRTSPLKLALPRLGRRNQPRWPALLRLLEANDPGDHGRAVLLPVLELDEMVLLEAHALDPGAELAVQVPQKFIKGR